MSFLITGLPRIRSAWFSALLDCHHDAITTFGSLDKTPPGIDLCDPSAAVLYPLQALERFDTFVIIQRPEAESRKSIERWSGIDMPNPFWADCLENYQRLIDGAREKRTLTVDFHNLTDERVSAVCNFIGKPQTMSKIRRFQSLKIEQGAI